MGLSGHQNCVFKIFEGEELQDFMLSQYYSHHPKQLLTFYNPFKLLYVTSPEILIPPLNFLQNQRGGGVFKTQGKSQSLYSLVYYH